MKTVLTFLMSAISFILPATSEFKETRQTTELTVIMYHHISEKNSLLNSYVITPEEFESDLKYLSEHGYTSVTTKQITDNNIPEKAVMITFDDGFLSTYKYAKPILEKYNMTAVCAIIGSVMEEYTQNPNTVSDCAYMDISTVREMLSSGTFEIACHTYDMHKTDTRKGCSKISWEDDNDYITALTNDLTSFNNLYNEAFNSTTDIIAFPYGEYSDLTVSTAYDCGYRIMLTCDEKVNKLSFDSSSPIILGRFNRPHGVSSQDFFTDKLHSS